MFEDFFEEMKDMQNQMNKMFKDLSKQAKFSDLKSADTDISETEDNVFINIDMPGVEKENIDLILTEDSISVKAKRKQEELEEKEGFFRRERSYKGYNIYTTLPAKIVPETAEAEYKKGVLKVKVKKAKKAKEKQKKKIEIN